MHSYKPVFEYLKISNSAEDWYRFPLPFNTLFNGVLGGFFFVLNKLHTLRDMIGRDMIGPSTLSIPRVYRGMNTGEGPALNWFYLFLCGEMG